MHARGNKLGVYTTVYPAVVKYLPEWYRSVQSQTDSDFELWIGLDALLQGDVEAAVGSTIDAQWVWDAGISTPATIRNLALRRMTASGCDVVLVDSDDILLPSRVAAAREALRTSDLAACALEIVDGRGEPLGAEFNLDPASTPSHVLPRNNIFGFSNSAYRCELLDRALPIPSEAVLVDWYIATRAWLFGAELSFDRTVRMKYRQYEAKHSTSSIALLA